MELRLNTVAYSYKSVQVQIGAIYHRLFQQMAPDRRSANLRSSGSTYMYMRCINSPMYNGADASTYTHTSHTHTPVGQQAFICIPILRSNVNIQAQFIYRINLLRLKIPSQRPFSSQFEAEVICAQQSSFYYTQAYTMIFASIHATSTYTKRISSLAGSVRIWVKASFVIVGMLKIFRRSTFPCVWGYLAHVHVGYLCLLA